MTNDRIAAIIANDLDSLVHRIESLPSSTHYTEALTSVQKARDSIQAGRLEIHQDDLRGRFGP